MTAAVHELNLESLEPELEIVEAHEALGTLDLEMAALVAEIDSVFTAEDEAAMEARAAHKGSSPCDSPTQEWVE